MIKSSRRLFDALRSALVKAHSYEVPEVVALPILDGAPEYLQWLQRESGSRVSDALQLLAPGLALIFDMDGVIVDSNPMHREAWAAFNRRYGLETTEAMHDSMYGKRNDEIVRNFFGDGLPEEEVLRAAPRKRSSIARWPQASSRRCWFPA